MNPHIAKLFAIAQKNSRRIVGLMSGTSLDGLDVALCRVTGSGASTALAVEQFQTVPYSDDIKAQVRAVFAKQTIDFRHLALLNEWIGTLHAEMVLACLRAWGIAPVAVDLIASHGQTVMHAPKRLHGIARFGNATLQIGDGDHIAVRTGIVTLSDFRQKHIAAGGEGAPLAVYGDYLLFSKAGENRIMLNIGGIANFTYLPGSMAAGEVFVTDTGPGNTLIDGAMREHFGQPFDANARIAMSGKVNQPLLQALKAHAFFAESFPKTTGPELFGASYIAEAMAAAGERNVQPHDLIATLTRFSAETIADAVRRALTGQNLASFTLYASGGGAHNPLLMRWMSELLPCPFSRTDALGINGDAKEAILFALLANEAVAGGAADFGGRPDVPSVTMGKISLPG